MEKLNHFYRNLLSGEIEQGTSWLSSMFFNLLSIFILAGIFGVIVGTYEGGQQVLYAGIKIPLLMLVTSIITIPFMLITGLITVGGIKLKFLVQSINFALTQTALIMFALIPVMWLMVQSHDYRLNILTLSLIFIFAGGIAILRTNNLFKKNLKFTGTKLILLTLSWAIIYTFVAGQVWWLMRPWIGYTYQKSDLPFVRPLEEDAINNVYESIQLTSKTWYERNILN